MTDKRSALDDSEDDDRAIPVVAADDTGLVSNEITLTDYELLEGGVTSPD